jgi:hypothetical protein
MARPAQRLQIGAVKPTLRRLAHGDDVVNHLGASLDTIPSALAAVRFVGKHLGAQLAPLSVVSALC